MQRDLVLVLLRGLPAYTTLRCGPPATFSLLCTAAVATATFDFPHGLDWMKSTSCNHSLQHVVTERNKPTIICCASEKLTGASVFIPQAPDKHAFFSQIEDVLSGRILWWLVRSSDEYLQR